MDGLSYFDQLEDQTQGALDSLDTQVAKANADISETIKGLYFQLDRDSSGNIKPSVDNLKLIDSFKNILSNILEKGAYGIAIGEFFKSFSKGSGYMDNYFTATTDVFRPTNGLYQAILESNISTTADQLLGAGVNANFRDPIIKILKDAVTSGSTKAEFIQTIEENVVDNNGILGRYINQVASDSITQFNSNYINTISKDLGLKYYYYKGTKIKDSRSFCKQLAGKYITADQLKAFVEQQMQLNGGKGWDGMIKGENWSNFPIYRGGWNCRHYLIPVSKSIYDQGSNKWAA